MSKISRMLSGVRPLEYRARASAFVTVPADLALAATGDWPRKAFSRPLLFKLMPERWRAARITRLWLSEARRRRPPATP
jgi:hypothetical protein